MDNGILVKKNDKTVGIEDELARVFEENRTYYSVTYWRKCYNIRNEILYIINHRYDEDYEYVLDEECVDQIIEYLQSLDADTWNDSGHSLWDWEEMEEQIRRDIENLCALSCLMQSHDVDVVFYDSY